MGPFVSLYRLLWRFGEKRTIIIFSTMFVFAQSFSFFEPLIIGWFLNTLQEKGIQDPWLLIWIGSSYIAIQLFFWAFHGPARVMEISHAYRAKTNFKQYFMQAVCSQPSLWHTNHPSGDTIDRIEKGSQGLNYFARDTYEVIEMVFRFISSFIILTIFHWHAAYLIILTLYITFWIIIKMDKFILPMYDRLNENENSVSARVYDILSNIQTIITMRVEKLVLSGLWQKMTHIFSLQSKTNIRNETKWFLVTMTTSIMTIAVLLSYVLTNSQTALIGTVFILFGYVDRINSLCYRFAYRYGDMTKNNSSAMNALALEKDFETKINVEQTLPANWKRITLANLVFSYKEAKRTLELNDISFDIKRGEKIAFIGESGSGKTTMLKLIRGLYKPQSVDVSVDGQKVPLDEITGSITLIPQESELFNASIKENITFGEDVPIEYLRKYTDFARITPVIERLTNKWDSKIKERGVNLSGGERQRLALARGLYVAQTRDIVLLDEPTSALDPKHESEVFKNIFDEFSDKSIVCVMHRLHLLPLFDTIYVFEKGKVLCHGPYKKVIKHPHVKSLIKKYS